MGEAQSYEFTLCAGCATRRIIAPLGEGKQLCDDCVQLLLPFENDCTEAMIERVRAKLVERTLGAHADNPNSTLTFGPTHVDAGATVAVSMQMHSTCRPCALRLPDDVAKAFRIDDIRIGNVSQVNNPGGAGVDGRFYGETYQNQFGRIPMKLDTLFPATLFAMRVTNRTAVGADFTALWEIETHVVNS